MSTPDAASPDASDARPRSRIRQGGTETRADARILNASAIMAAGTVVSRMSGFVRSALLVAALGGSLHADLFTMANTIPNMVYILVAGGVMNAVLVPQLVRTMQNDADGGEAYANRIVTLAVLFLGAVTALLVIAAPWVMDIFLSAAYDRPDLAAERQSAVDFARYCLPQVFFYGMFVLAGQILNARGRFGPMMWAPIANNVIAVGVLVVYLVAFGPATAAEQVGPFTTSQELLLGLGSTLGIVVQFLILVPYLRLAGFRFRPRLDVRGVGLGHTFRLATWTVLFVIVNQVAYSVVVRLASSGSAEAVTNGGQSSGYTVYSTTFLVVMVPHAVVTVSLATALLPRMSRLASDGDLPTLARTLGLGLRTALAVAIPFALLLPIIADDLAHVTFGWGAGQDDYVLFAPSLALFGTGLVFFTIHYITLRGFYALERNRTVFFIQCAVAATNIAAAIVLVGLALGPRHGPGARARLHRVVRRGVGRVVRRARAAARRPGDRAAAVVPGPARAGRAARERRRPRASGGGGAPTRTRRSGPRRCSCSPVTAVDVGLFLLLAHLLRLEEVTAVLRTVTGRLAPRRGGTTSA